MSKMSNLEITVIEMLEDGYTCSDIAQKLEIPRIWVEDLMQDFVAEHEEYYEPCSIIFLDSIDEPT